MGVSSAMASEWSPQERPKGAGIAEGAQGEITSVIPARDAGPEGVEPIARKIPPSHGGAQVCRS